MLKGNVPECYLCEGALQWTLTAHICLYPTGSLWFRCMYIYVCVRGCPPNGWCPYLSLACAGFPGQGRVRLWVCMCALAEGWDDGTGTFDWWVIVQPDSARLNWWGHGLREEVLFVLFTFSCPSVWRLAILFLFIALFYFFLSFFQLTIFFSLPHSLFSLSCFPGFSL